METPNQKFRRLGERRTNEVISKLRLIMNLSNKRNYEYTETEAKQLLDAIEFEFKIVKKSFEQEINSQMTEFKFTGGDKDE